MNKLMHNLIMYHEIHRLKREGFKPAWIGRHLVLDRRTVKKYLAMSEEEFMEFKHRQLVRCKVLDSYEEYVKSRLEEFPEASAAQVHDWLKERHVDFIDVSEKTIFNFVLYLREKHGIPKPFNYRDCAQVDQLPYGQQAQVDFGEYNMSTQDSKRKKVYFFSMVLSRSRHKYVVFSESPFNTLAAIEAHEKCFWYFQGIPRQLVYDQDKLLLVDENKGNLILTEAFRQYVDHRKFKLHFCRKADPQSKGKIENVIKYIKYNFLGGRKYIDNETLNGQALAWLERTANAKIHAATKQIPHQEWLIEKQHLEPLNEIFTPGQPLKSYTVRKDNTIACKGNFYQLPLGTYRGHGSTVKVKLTDQAITIYDRADNEITSYKPHSGKGKLVRNSNFKRDYSTKIDELIREVSSLFENRQQAIDYLQMVRQDNPRYIRDQLLMIRKMSEDFTMQIMDAAMDLCMENRILKATDMESIAKKIRAENNNDKDNCSEPIVINTLNKSAFKIIPEKSNISDYKNLMN
jgi:transposase